MSEENKRSTFYAAFEDRHRGSRELVAERLKVYRPFVEPLAGLYKDPRALDLGCGRGEWLELVNELGYQGVGVDIDEGMLAPCRKLSLNVQKQDALKFIKAQKENSCVVISAFHLVEHIPFDALQEIVEQSLRVLKEGGLLIMETPNPENLIVAGVNFYLDPTHQRPIPPDLLAFLPDYYGFERVKVLRLQHDLELAQTRDPTLMDVLSGVSPDYAVVARKAGGKSYIEATNAAFERDYGLTLQMLAEGFEEKANDQRMQLDELRKEYEDTISKVENISQRAAALSVRAEELEGNLEKERSRTERVDARLEEQLGSEREAREKLQAALTAQQERAARLEATLDADQKAKQRLESELGKEREAKERLESQLGEEREAHEKLQAELATQHESVARLEATLIAERKEEESLKSELSGEREAGEKLQAELASQQKDITRLETLLAAEREEKERQAVELAAERNNRKQLEQHLQSKVAQIKAFKNSLSWKITAPLRFGFDLIKWLIKLPILMLRGLQSGAANCMRWSIVHVMKVVLRYPILEVGAYAVVRRWPSLNDRLKALAISEQLISPSSEIKVHESLQETQLSSEENEPDQKERSDGVAHEMDFIDLAALNRVKEKLGSLE